MPWYAQIGTFVCSRSGHGAFYTSTRCRRKNAHHAEKRLNGCRSTHEGSCDGSEAAGVPRAGRGARDAPDESAGGAAEEKDARRPAPPHADRRRAVEPTIKSFKPRRWVTRELAREWPITLELDGTYHNLAMFFDRVASSRASSTSAVCR